MKTILILVSLMVFSGRASSQTASGSVQNADGSKTLINCTYGGCLETTRSSDYQFALGKARSKDGQKCCDKWAGPGSWSGKNLDKKPAARANVQACKDAGRIK
jgi:hypothetical protein